MAAMGKASSSSSSSASWRSSSTGKRNFIGLIAMPILIAVLLQRILLFYGIESPPSTYGSGTMFDTIATRYDIINRILAIGLDIGWRKQLVTIIRDSVSSTDGPINILDVATGTADVAIQLAKHIPNSKIIGIDPSNNMLAIGRQKVEKELLNERIVLQYADAQQLVQHFQNNKESYFDGATIAFGIRNVPDRTEAICQILHVLKDNAKLCILEFSEPDVETFGTMGLLARYFIRYIVPTIGGILSGSPKEYWHLQKSIDTFPKPNDFITMVVDSSSSSSSPPTTTTTQSEACETAGGRFEFNGLKQLNFGSVQLYTFTARKSKNKNQNESSNLRGESKKPK